jgi:hypothetical protein
MKFFSMISISLVVAIVLANEVWVYAVSSALLYVLDASPAIGFSADEGRAKGYRARQGSWRLFMWLVCSVCLVRRQGGRFAPIPIS